MRCESLALRKSELGGVVTPMNCPLGGGELQTHLATGDEVQVGTKLPHAVIAKKHRAMPLIASAPERQF